MKKESADEQREITRTVGRASANARRTGCGTPGGDADEISPRRPVRIMTWIGQCTDVSNGQVDGKNIRCKLKQDHYLNSHPDVRAKKPPQQQCANLLACYGQGRRCLTVCAPIVACIRNPRARFPNERARWSKEMPKYEVNQRIKWSARSARPSDIVYRGWC